jgi:hypothetical protein
MVLAALVLVVFLFLPDLQAVLWVLLAAVLQSLLHIYWVPIERREA